MDPIYQQRKVLVRGWHGQGRSRAHMTMARFVPWGIQPEEGIQTLVLGNYLGIRRDHFTTLLRKLGITSFYGPPVNMRRRTRSKRRLISERDAAKVIVHVRAREGRARAAPRAVSTAVPARRPKA